MSTNSFHVGDRVKVKDGCWPHAGSIGVIVSTEGDEVEVDFSESVVYQASELERMEKTKP